MEIMTARTILMNLVVPTSRHSVVTGSLSVRRGSVSTRVGTAMGTRTASMEQMKRAVVSISRPNLYFYAHPINFDKIVFQ